MWWAVGPVFLCLAARGESSKVYVVRPEAAGVGLRTGSFLASTHFGVVPDYILLSKALGGGLCKVSALLVDSDRYLSEFGLLHTSTFAGDNHSSAVALEALNMLDENQGALMDQCAKQGSSFVTRLNDLQKRYPGALQEVRGRGLLMAVELIPRENTSSIFLSWHQLPRSYFFYQILIFWHHL